MHVLKYYIDKAESFCCEYPGYHFELYYEKNNR